MAPHSSTLAWKILWMEEPGGLQSMGSHRVGHDWATSLSLSCTGEGNGKPLQGSCLENPRDGEPGGLPTMGSHRVGHDWSDLAAAAAAATAAAVFIYCCPTASELSRTLTNISSTGNRFRVITHLVLLLIKTTYFMEQGHRLCLWQNQLAYTEVNL